VARPVPFVAASDPTTDAHNTAAAAAAAAEHCSAGGVYIYVYSGGGAQVAGRHNVPREFCRVVLIPVKGFQGKRR